MHNIIPDHTRAVLFDHDDTIVGTIEACWELDKYVARKWYNKNLKDEEIRANWHLPLHELLPIIFGIHEDEVDLALERILASYPDYPKKVLPGVERALGFLHRQEYILGVVSSTSRRTLEYDLTKTQLKKFFGYIQTQEDTLYHKPDQRVFEPTIEWLKKQDIHPENVLYIGDGLHDMKAAQEAGFHFLGVESGLVDAGKFREAGATSIASIDLLNLS